MITGRDDEFRATARALYLEECGRTADRISAAELDGWVQNFREGLTGEQARVAFHNSAEAVAFRAKPPTPTTPRIRVDGLRFVTERGDEWTMAFTDGFRDYERLLRQGPNAVRPLLQEAQDLGANGRRVFGAFDFGTPQEQHLYPAEHPDFYARIPELFALYADFGLYGQFCVFADTKRSVPGVTRQHDHWQAVSETVRPIPNLLLQRVNENDQHENGVDAFLLQPAGILSSFGSNGTGNDPPQPFWDYADLGSERRDGRMVLSTTSVFFAQRGYGSPTYPGAWRPTVVSEPPKLGKDITNPRDAFLLGLGCQWGNGGCAHTQGGVMSILLPPDERELTRQFLRGVKA